MMLKKKDYPILEYDENKNAIIEPANVIAKASNTDYCVITYFRDVIEKKSSEGSLKQVFSIDSETVDLPVYETWHHNQRICLVLGFLGSAGAAGQLEELIAYGIKNFIVCGGAGVLQKNIAPGHLIVPHTAVRDEGVSYHYLEPSREIECNSDVISIIENTLTSAKIPFLRAKTWTTDSFYRETRDKVELRISEGCLTVEMEAAAFFAVSKFRGVKLGQILYSGDDLSGDIWDSRKWNRRNETRESLVDLSMDICLNL